MFRERTTRWVGHLAMLVTLAALPSSANASSLTSYNVIDLGAGTAAVQTGANGLSEVVAPDGSVYAFPRTDNRPLDVAPILANFPPFTNAPTYATMTYGNPRNAYSDWDQGFFLNRNGVFVGTDVYGVSGHSQNSGSIVIVAQRQSDGSFGSLDQLWGSPNNHFSGGQIATALDLNNQNQILGVQGYFSYERSYLLYDYNAKTLSYLNQLPAGWQLTSAVALDDQGRILAYAFSPTSKGDHAVLLTPEGLSTTPLTVPEVPALATLVVGMVGLVAVRRKTSILRS